MQLAFSFPGNITGEGTEFGLILSERIEESFRQGNIVLAQHSVLPHENWNWERGNWVPRMGLCSTSSRGARHVSPSPMGPGVHHGSEEGIPVSIQAAQVPAGEGQGGEGKGGEGPGPDPVRGSVPWPPHVCTAGVLQDLWYCSFERRRLEPAQQPWEDCHSRPGRFH